MKIKPVEVKYIESGAFQGCEEDCRMRQGDDCIVVTKKNFAALNAVVAAAREHYSAAQTLRGGDATETDHFNAVVAASALRKALEALGK